MHYYVSYKYVIWCYVYVDGDRTKASDNIEIVYVFVLFLMFLYPNWFYFNFFFSDSRSMPMFYNVLGEFPQALTISPQ